MTGGFFAEDSINGLLLAWFLVRGLFSSRNIPTSGKIGQKWGTRFCPKMLHAFWNDDFLRDLCVDRGYVVSAAAVVEDADYWGVGAVDGANDASFGSAVVADLDDIYQHQIAVHGVADLVRRDEDVARELSL